MEASFHEAADAGSMRFSTNLRDQAYKSADYAKRERPLWLPEVVARELLDEMDWPEWAVYAAALVVLVLCGAVMRELVECGRGYRRESIARELLRSERAEKAAAAVAKAAKLQTTKPAAAGEQPDDGMRRTRFCRFCDIAIEDAFMESHVGGKKHMKLAAASVSTGDCWVWRVGEAPAVRPTETPIEEAKHDDTDVRQHGARMEVVAPPSQVRSGGGGDGGRGAWTSAAPKQTRRRKCK